MNVSLGGALFIRYAETNELYPGPSDQVHYQPSHSTSLCKQLQSCINTSFVVIHFLRRGSSKYIKHHMSAY